MSLKKFSVFSIILILAKTAFSATNLALACGSTQSCGELSQDIGYAVLGTGALIAPHFAGGSVFSNGNSKSTLSFGQKNFKALSIEMNSNLQKNSHGILSSDLKVQVFDKNIPSTIRYGIGGGYEFHINHFTHIMPLIKLAFEKIESVDKTNLKPQLDLEVSYDISDQIVFDSGARAVFYDDIVWGLIAGMEYRFGQGSSDQNSDMNLFGAIGIEDNSQLGIKIHYVSIGAKF